MSRLGSPTDLIVIFISLLLLTGGAGSQIWLYSITNSYTIRLNAIAIVLIIAGSTISCIRYTTHVYRHLHDYQRPQSSGIQVIGQLAPFIFLFALCVIWGATASYILETYPHPFFVLIGLVNAYLLARLIVQSVTVEPTIHFYGIQGLLFLTFLASFISSSRFLPWSQNRLTAPLNFVLVYGMLVLAWAQWTFFFVCVVWQLSEFLGIPILTVPKEKQNKISTDEKSHLLLHEERYTAESRDYRTSPPLLSIPVVEKSDIDPLIKPSGSGIATN